MCIYIYIMMKHSNNSTQQILLGLCIVVLSRCFMYFLGPSNCAFSRLAGGLGLVDVLARAQRWVAGLRVRV